MNDAQLDTGIRIDRFNRLGKALKAIDAGDEDVLHPTGLPFSEHAQPEFGALVFRQPPRFERTALEAFTSLSKRSRPNGRNATSVLSVR